ncbi:hypothetical protein D929_01669 [Enterococcus faecalis 02-MB-P-10]|nr:hypothetical protein D929_01669 [Enterococcus faecalis 02-MB-P-10]
MRRKRVLRMPNRNLGQNPLFRGGAVALAPKPMDFLLHST